MGCSFPWVKSMVSSCKQVPHGDVARFVPWLNVRKNFLNLNLDGLQKHIRKRKTLIFLKIPICSNFPYVEAL